MRSDAFRLLSLALVLTSCGAPPTAEAPRPSPTTTTVAPSPPPTTPPPPPPPTSTTYVSHAFHYRIDVPASWTIRRGNVLDADAPGLAPLDAFPTIEWRVGTATEASLSIDASLNPTRMPLAAFVEEGHRDRTWLRDLTDTTVAGHPAVSLVTSESSTHWIDDGDRVISVLATTRAGATADEIRAAIDSLRLDVTSE